MEAVTTKIPHEEKENFVTVVSVGSEAVSKKCDTFEAPHDSNSNSNNSSGYVTVLTIGDNDEDSVNVSDTDIIEEVLVYRLPGERLGFGLKFEGGTKANEFVKRLFIQSCAPESPASRVQSSWGKLSEGDEVLEIDCLSVNTMTRIDCVRCLKDSNVVIKLLVRHFYADIKQSSGDLSKTRSVEDLPQVISAEKKRTPPPPPPVPPRKIPKKYYKNANNNSSTHHKEIVNNSSHEIINNNNPIPSIRHQINTEVTVSVNNKNKKFQSPRSSGRSSYSPDIPRRDRRFSDGSLGPPDAEVYVDLFSQESTQSLSESDDTGSSISTVVDRFCSFPTTTASSLAGSLPTTPTSIQKHLDFSNLLNSYEDEEFSTVLNKTVNSFKQSMSISKNIELVDKNEKIEDKHQSNNDEGIPLQPPSCFQDAPLSYGNEDMRIETKSNGTICESPIVENSMNNHINEKSIIKSATLEDKVFKKPPVPPRSKDLINVHKVNGCVKENQNIHDENMNISNLPRLVDFVPKCTIRESFDDPVAIINIFLENERRDTDYLRNETIDDSEGHDLVDDYNGLDVFSSKWSLSPQLTTIGEVEEEGNPESFIRSLNSTPIVIVENAYNDELDDISPKIPSTNIPVTHDVKGINGKMDTLSSDSRQPPDGHEFPDYEESNSELGHNKFGRDPYVDERVIESSGLIKTFKSVECVNSSQNRSSFINDFSSVPLQNKSVLNKINSVSNSDLSSINSKDPYDSCDEVTLKRTGLEPTLHTRSQSLIDMSAISKQKGDRWSLLAEQRKKGLSKLKGLVIPEHVSESDTSSAVNIPEIISHNTASFVLETKNDANQTQYHYTEPEPVALPLTSPPWSSETNNTSTIPKYSPAFKRKSLQIYPMKSYKNDESQPRYQITTAINYKMPVKTINNDNNNSATVTKLDSDELRLDNLSDAPKSLESITSPTRSDCSFDYITNSYGKTNKYNNNNNKIEVNTNIRVLKESPNYVSRLHKDLGKSEDESDNDSAVSSSQSSYISRCSPPPSPTRSCEMLDYESNLRQKSEDARLLKAASVEAINRKNILASAKCRSGRDLKVGSPIIQRKYEDDDSLNTSSIETDNSISNQSSPSPSKQEFECNSTESPALVTIEKRSISYEETAETPEKKSMVNGVEDKKQNDVGSLPIKKVETHTPFVSLKPVALRRNSSETKNTKSVLRNDYVKPSSILSKNQKSMSVTDLRKSFEKFGSAPPPLPHNNTKVVKEIRPKLEPKTKKTLEKSIQERKTTEVETVAKLETAKTKPNLLRKPVEQEKDEKEIASPSEDNNRRKLVLCPEFVGGSIGITLAGGTDYETKEITVHRIRYGSAAYNDGTLKKGDRIVSINGKSTAGVTHAESVEMLKEAVAKFILIVEKGKEGPAVTSPQRKSFIYESSEAKGPSPAQETKKVTNVVTLVKDGAGLGFSIEGGKDSLQGDLPLRIKKIFQGGAAEKSGDLLVSDELLAINDASLINFSRIEAWSLMKKLPDGNVSIHIHR